MIILDSSFLVAFYNTNDQNHVKAVGLMKEIIAGKFGVVVISDYIFDEVVTVALIKLKSLKEATRIGNSLLSAVMVLTIDKSLFDSTWNRFKTQRSTHLSFTDCSILEMASKNDIDYIATFDKEFKKSYKNVIGV